MKFRTRALAYVGAGAAGLFATGVFAAPALAADEADVSVKAASSKIAVGAGLKLFRYDVKNAGPGAATDAAVTVDLAGLDPEQIDLDIAALEAENAITQVKAAGEREYVLDLGDVAAGATLALPLPLFLKGDAKPGAAGTLKLSVKSTATDPNVDNNVVSIPVEVTESGVDLTVVVEDVYALGEDGEGSPVPPGGTAPLFWGLLNQGDQAAKGLRIGITLPEHVSFVDDYEGCTLSADRRVLSCEDADALLEPGYAFFDDEGLPVKVSKDAPGPVTLTGGSLKASAIAGVEEPTDARSARTAPAFGALTAVKAEQVLADIDPGDNNSEFSVFVGEAGGSGGGGELPVTGVQAGLIGGVGLAVLAGGGVLFLMARRRKLVLVTPDDETPTA